MRFLILLCVLALPASAALSPEFAQALDHFNTDGPVGWSFTQTTHSGGKALVEHYEGSKPEFERWSLVSTDDRTPTADENKDYMQRMTRRSSGDRPPRLAEQIDLENPEAVSDDSGHAVVRFRMKRGEDADKTAAFLRVTIAFEKATRTIDSVTISNTEPFAPLFGVKVSEMKTVMIYSLPTEKLPSLLQSVTTRVRGRAFFRSMDEDMLVTYADYAWAGRGKPTGALLKPAI